MLVKDIMQRNYSTLYSDDLATKARAALRDLKLRVMPVVDEHKILVGVITRNHLMQITSSISPVRVKGLMDAKPFTVSPDMDSIQAMREMVSRDQWYVPVVRSPQDNSYVGILGLEDFIRSALKKNATRLSAPLSEIMSKEPLTCSPNDEVDNVWKLMKDHSFAACPVVEKGRPVGIVTQQDLLESGAIFPRFEAAKGRFNAPTKVTFLMKTPAFSLKPTNSIKEAVALMLKRNIGRLPIVDEKDKLVGIVDREDIVRALIK